MQTHDWSKFTLRIPVNANRDSLYRSWATQEGLEKWFLRKAAFKKPAGELVERNAFIETGDTYEWLWHGYGDDTVERGAILEANGNDSLKFSFGKAGNVTVTIKEEGGETLVELVQDEIPTDEQGKEYYHLGCSKGWTFYLANLKSIVEGGLDLRNRSLELKDVVSS